MQNDQNFLVWLIRQKAFSLMLLLVVVLTISIISYSKIPVEVMPKESVSPFLYVKVNAPVTAEVSYIETNLTIPLEKTLRTVSNIKEIKTTTSMQDCSFFVSFKPGTEMDTAHFQVTEALQDFGATREDIKTQDMSVYKFNPDAAPLMVFALTLPPKSNANELSNQLKRVFLQLPGIAKIQIRGIQNSQIEMQLTKEMLDAHQVKSGELTDIFNATFDQSSLGSTNLRSALYKTPVRTKITDNKWSSLLNKNIKKGSETRLRHISKHQLLKGEQLGILHKNGQPSIFLEVFKKDEANLFAVNEAVSKRISSLKKEPTLLSKVEFETILNRSKTLKKAMGGVFESLYLAIIITFMVVYIFLRKMTPTLIITLAIPVSLLVVISLLHITGKTLNMITLSGLILAIGLIVDNAIVVVERIYQRINQGDEKWLAASLGAKDVAMPLFMSTCTTIIIFLPAVFLEGADTFTMLLKSFQMPVVFSLIASYVVALLFVPIGSTVNVKARKENEKSGQFFFPLFKWITRHKASTFLVTISLLFLLFTKVKDIEEVDIESPPEPFINVSLQFNSELNESEKSRSFKRMEKFWLTQRESLGINFIIAEYSKSQGNASFQIYPKYSPKESRNLQRQKAKEAIKEALFKASKSPGVGVEVDYESAGGFSAKTPKKSYAFTGPKVSHLETLLAQIGAEIEQVEGVLYVNSMAEERGRLTFQFVPDENALQTAGIKLDDLRKNLSGLTRKYGVPNLSHENKQIELNAQILPSFHSKGWESSRLAELKISIGNQFFPLNSLGELVPQKTINSINRENSLSEMRLFVYFDESYSKQDLRYTRRDIKDLLADYPYPKGYGVKKSDILAKILAMKQRGQFVIILAVFFIYLILASLFESILLPFAILFTVPLAIIFGVTGLYAFDFDLDPMARLGLIILVGVVVNNAIILIDVIINLRSQGLKINDAIASGCSQRITAVFMTSCTTICGLLPVALGQSTIMGIPYATLGICIISGMLFSTIITLILVPIMFYLFDHLEVGSKKFLNQLVT